jgi:polyketide synthase 12
VLGTVIVPGAALAELALAGGRQVGTPAVEELILQAPLVLPAGGTVLQLQVNIAEADKDGRRAVAVYTRPQTAGLDERVEATCHARGTLAPEAEPPARALPGPWPPDGAVPVPVEGLYERLAEVGYEYGPAFRGLRAAWRDGTDTYAEVALPDEAGAAAGFAVHPALLDAALHASMLEKEAGTPANLPFSWSGIRAGQVSGPQARVKITPAGESAFRVEVADDSGALIVSADAVAVRPVDRAQLEGTLRNGRDSLFTLDWVPVRAADDARAVPAAVLGELAGPGARYPDLGALISAVAAGAAVPEAVAAAVPGMAALGGAAADAVQSAHVVAGEALGLVQGWLGAGVLSGSRLVLVTRGAVAAAVRDSPDVAAAAVWGLVRSAQSEHPGRFVLADLDPDAGAGGDGGQDGPGWAVLAGLGEPQLAVRGGRVLAPRLTRAAAPAVPGGAPWRLSAVAKGSLEGLAIVPSGAGRPLDAGEVRVGVRAAGLNFRDVLIALGLYPGDAPLGSEAAGVVLEAGPGVTDLAPGDRVMGLVPESFGPVAAADRRMLARVPDGWSFEQAAAVPVAYLTAYYGLADLAGLRPGERVLVHAAAGGVGMAAVQLARHLGAEVYATASPAKWDAVRALGVPDGRIASSRDLRFAGAFAQETGGAGMDVVLDALAGEFVDASLGLLPRGGRFIEMGKADVRDPRAVAEAHPGVRYRAFDLFEAGADRIREMLGEVVDLFGQGVLEHAPARAWDVRDAQDAFRFLREGRNTGKVVFTVPQPPDPDGAVLVTGGTGGLGALVARHLATAGGARNLVLASRRGLEAPGAAGLAAELEAAGCRVRVAACDVADREQLSGLLGSLEAPLAAVVHAAGVLDDGLVESLTPERLERVMRPKADAALLLDELTAGTDLRSFVLFSSVAGLLGNAGQGNYAAANAVLDALAARRRAAGRPAVSLAWGLWEASTGMTGEMRDADLARMGRLGLLPMTSQLGLELLDAAQRADAPLVAPVRLDLAALRAQARAGTAPPLLAGLVREPGRPARAAGGGTLAARLAQADRDQWERVTLDLVTAQAAAVLGHASAAAVDPGRAFKDLGFDSLAAVELRNRLAQVTGLKLPATLVFDHPTPIAVARHILGEAAPAAEAGASGVHPAAWGATSASSGSQDGNGTFGALMRHAHTTQSIAEALPLLTEASRFRPTFESSGLPEDGRYVVKLASGSGLPKLVCVPSFMPGSGPHQFMRFADRFEGTRDVFACSLPGFHNTDSAPGSWHAAIEVLVGLIRRAVGDEPFVLVGYSIGGVIAHSIAAGLEEQGTAPAGVVMIDTPTPTGEVMIGIFSQVMTEILDRDHGTAVIDDASWLAMGSYVRLLAERNPVQISPASLLIRAGRPLGEGGDVFDWPAWNVCDDQVEIDADHFALIETSSAATAAATERWLTGEGGDTGSTRARVSGSAVLKRKAESEKRSQ